ncbi:hypothetical protein [Salinisphaera aquimarina]|uniref:Alginate export domain-containing protein n=1 Tax=Salinisphaera aquimarina TaxID=2094031 RepID=A0ABV7ESV5_9GAMM
MKREFNHKRDAGTAALRSAVRRTLGLSALVAMGCFASAANATLKTDFGVDYRATGFYVDSDSFAVAPPRGPDGQRLDDQTSADSSDNGFANYLRLRADFKHEETGVEVHTRIELAGDRWSGDARNYTTTGQRAFNADNNGDNIRLDLGFVQIPFSLGLLRVGRQEANWNNCLLVCDDRRDRALFLTKLGNVSAFIGYDRRQDNTPFYNEDNGNQIFPGLVAPIGSTGWTLGMLYVHWLNNYNGDLVDTDPSFGPDANGDGVPDVAAGSTGARNAYVLSNANIFSPYMQGKVGPLDISFGGNYLHNGNVNANQTVEDGDYFTDDAYSEYFRVGATLGMFELKAQYVGTQDGGLISSGFDTYSSLINSNPESTANPTSLYRMGGFLGRQGFDEDLYIGAVTVNVSPKFALRGAVGFLNVDVPLSATTTKGNDTSTVYDLQASYQLNSAVRTWATLGMLKENDVGTLAGNSLVGSIPNGGSFADERVIAGSVNLGVEF